MAPLSNETKAARIRATKNAASAFLEDMQYLREVTARIETSRGELRRLSAVLRRLLIETDLTNIAAPRMGRIKLLAPNNKFAYKLADAVYMAFFSNSGAAVFGVGVKAIGMMNLGKPKTTPEEHIRKRIGNVELLGSYETVLLRPRNFLKQKIICYAQHWVSRQSVISYVANFLSGVHSGNAVEFNELLMEPIRRACTYSIEDGNLKVHVLPEMGENSLPLIMAPMTGTLTFDAAALDPLLVEVLATANLLVTSPDVARLEAHLSEELS